jgi:p-aminobenzoyl-glutamate transporter AbgT
VALSRAARPCALPWASSWLLTFAWRYSIRKLCSAKVVFANAVSEGVKDLAALLIPDAAFSLAQSERRLVAGVAAVAAQVSIGAHGPMPVHHISSVFVCITCNVEYPAVACITSSDTVGTT